MQKTNIVFQSSELKSITWNIPTTTVSGKKRYYISLSGFRADQGIQLQEIYTSGVNVLDTHWQNNTTTSLTTNIELWILTGITNYNWDIRTQ